MCGSAPTGWIDETGDVVVLRDGGEGVQFLAAERQEHAARFALPMASAAATAWSRLPLVAGPQASRRAGRAMASGDAGALARTTALAEMRGAIGVRGVDHRLDRLLA